jgi:hypothetical protein
MRFISSTMERICTKRVRHEIASTKFFPAVGMASLRVFENRVLRRICGPKRDEVTGEWRKLHSGELHNLYLSPDIIRQIK